MDGACSYTFDPDDHDDSTLAEAWECPHEAVPECDFCLFHVDPEVRRDRGIDEAAVTSAFREVVQAKGREQKRLVGARFDELNLGHAVFDEAADTHPIDLRHAQIRGTLDCSKAVVSQPIDLRHASLGAVDFHDAEFSGAVTMTGSTVRGTTTAREAVVRGDFAARETSFEAEVVLTGASFHGDASFEAVTFEAAVDLCETRFLGDVTFERATFGAAVAGRGAEFDGGAHVETDDLRFVEAVFEGPVDFEGAKVGYADFSGATFEDEVGFDAVRFREDAYFEDVTVAGSAALRESRFFEDVSFADATFAGGAAFDGVEFHGGDNVREDDVCFRRVRFEKEASFYGGQFAFVTFEDAWFGGEADFQSTSYDELATFENVEFCDRTTFEEAHFESDTSFEGTQFEGVTQFAGVVFEGGDDVKRDDLRLVGATFEESVDFASATFRDVDATGTTFGGEAVFSEGTFAGDLEFASVTFADRACFDEGRFQADATFSEAAFEAAASFRGVEFHGGDNLVDDDVSFAGATFADGVTFRRGEFGFADFATATVTGDLVCDGATFSDDAVFEGLTVDGQAGFDLATFSGEASFERATFGGNVVFDEAAFEDNASFADATFEDATDFCGTAFKGSATILGDDADFRSATFEERVDFSESEILYGNFSEVRFGDACFTKSRFTEGGTFTGSTVTGTFEMRDARFDGDVSFTDVCFEAPARFDGTVFAGGSNIETDDATFDDATFRDTASFNHVEFGSLSCRGTRFTGEAEFTRATFSEDVAFEAGPTGAVLLVDMTRAVLERGDVTQPENGATFYDLQNATVRDISFEGSSDDDYELLDYFRFSNTDFEGFEFSDHIDLLSRNNWTIHEFAYPEAREAAVAADGGEVAVTDDPSPASLESTYLKAKNSASAVGQRKVASEFYIKEFSFRRKKNAGIALDSDVAPLSRLRAGGKWLGNWLLHKSCGYGERIWRIVYASVLVVVVWGLLYATVTGGFRDVEANEVAALETFGQSVGSGVTDITLSLYFSLLTFTSLGTWRVEPVGPTARLLASVEAFLGALLLALVVFVLGRRMS